MENPLVSVVVVSYNHARYIHEMLESLKSQTYTNWELIVADDKSSDTSVEVIENWLNKNNVKAKKIYHTENTGVVKVLNEAIEICEGTYVKLIAADDFMRDDYLSKCIQKLEELGGEFGLIYSNMQSVDSDSVICDTIADYNRLWINETPETFRVKLKDGNKIAAPSALMRKEALISTGKYDESLLIEDYDRWLKINEKFYIAYIPEKLIYYRQHDYNISKLRKDKIEEETLILIIKFRSDIESKNIINSKVREYYIAKKSLPKSLLNTFKEYPHKERLLFLFAKYKLHPKLYIFIRNFL